jgi:hypothetical protein
MRLPWQKKKSGSSPEEVQRRLAEAIAASTPVSMPAAAAPAPAPAAPGILLRSHVTAELVRYARASDPIYRRYVQSKIDAGKAAMAQGDRAAANNFIQQVKFLKEQRAAYEAQQMPAAVVRSPLEAVSRPLEFSAADEAALAELGAPTSGAGAGAAAASGPPVDEEMVRDLSDPAVTEMGFFKKHGMWKNEAAKYAAQR